MTYGLQVNHLKLYWFCFTNQTRAQVTSLHNLDFFGYVDHYAMYEVVLFTGQTNLNISRTNGCKSNGCKCQSLLFQMFSFKQENF